MSNHQVLDNISHQKTKVNTSHSPSMMDNDSYARLALPELSLAQAEYPLFLRKNGETGRFEVIAMLGLTEQENLFVDEDGWHAQYVPLSIQRRPFLIGYQDEEKTQAMIHIDMDSPRVNESEGEDVFLAQGGQSDYLQNINSILRTLHEELPRTEIFANYLQQDELIEPVTLNIELDNGEKISVGSLYTIHEENLAKLSASSLEKFHQQGFLQAIYMMVASIHNVAKLIKRKNQRG